MTLREAITIMEVVCSTNRLRAIDMVEINPTLGTDKDVKVTVEAAKDIILAGLGHRRSRIGDPDKFTVEI